jgi:hypothetical protein
MSDTAPTPSGEPEVEVHTAPTVEIHEAPADPTPEPEAPAAVVAPVVVTDGGGIDPAVMTELLDLRTKVAELEAAALVTATTVAEVQQDAAEAQFTADIAQEQAGYAADIAAVVAEGDPTTPDDDIEPQREHSWFRPLGRRN